MSQYNKIFFQAASTGVQGWAAFVRACNKKQIPVSAAVTDSTSLLLDLQTVGKATGVGNRGNYRPTGSLSEHEMRQLGISWSGDFPLDQPDLLTRKNDSRYETRAGAEEGYEIIGKYHVTAVNSKIPPELDREMISICSWNEVRDYRGWQEATQSGAVDIGDTVEGYTGWADVIGRQAYWIGKELIRRKAAGEPWFRWAAFAFAGGNPEEGVWEQPGMLDYLRLAAEHPDVLGVALHEYSLTLNIMDGFADKTNIGRFEKLFAVCDQHKIARPWVEITEWGWEQDDIPEKAAAMSQIKEVAAYYAKFPEVKLAAIWTLSGDKNWGGINKKVAALAPGLYHFTQTTTFPDPHHQQTPSKPDKPQPDASLVEGIDISSANRTASLLQTHQPAFVFQRAVAWEGQHGNYKPIIEQHFADNVAACAAAGVPVGTYIVLYPNGITTSAKQFAQQIQAIQTHNGAKPLRGVIAVVIESLTPSHVHSFLQTLAAELPANQPKPIIQTRQPSWEKIMGADTVWAADYPLWIIDWDDQQPKIPSPWQAWDIWQYGSANWNGVAVDRNKMVANKLSALQLSTIVDKPHPTPQPEPLGPKIAMTPYFLPEKGKTYGPKITLHNQYGQGQSIQLYREGNISYLLKGNEHEKRLIANDKIYLTEDTSQGKGLFYTIQAKDTGWIPQQMAVGERYKRHETVTHKRLSDCFVVQAAQTSYTYMRFVQLHAHWKSPKNNNIAFSNVIELVWELENSQGGYDPQETYFYAVGVGLVGWSATRGEVGWIVEVTHGQQPLTLQKVNC